MKSLKVDAVTIERLVESEGPFAAPDFLFPDATPELVANEVAWLQPSFFDLEKNMLIMSFHSYVVRTPRHTILVDTCVGNDKQRPDRPFWHQLETPYLNDLVALGIQPEEVDYVMCTHLHADHIGWNTKLIDGRWVPTFPNARYVFARREYDYWCEQSKSVSEPVNHGAFEDSVLPIIESGQAVLVESDYCLDDHVWIQPAPGHTPGNVIINAGSSNQRAVLCGDTIHHPIQLTYPEWSSRFCEDPIQSYATRKHLLETLADTSDFLLAAHFPNPTAGRIVSQDHGFRFESY